MSHSYRATPLSTGVVVLDLLGVWRYALVSCLRSNGVASLELVLHYIRLENLPQTCLGGPLSCTPSRLRFPQIVGAAISVFWLGGQCGYWLFADFVGWNGEFSFLPSGVICRIGSVPTVLSFVHLATCITLGFGCFVLGWVFCDCFGDIVTLSLESATLCFIVAIFATVKAMTSLLLDFFYRPSLRRPLC